MDIIYYCTKNGHVPAKDYLVPRYGIGGDDDAKTRAHKVKILAKVEGIVKMAANKKGIIGEPYSSALHGYDFHEFKIDEGNELIRILYFAYHQEKLVLLNAYDKPVLYEKARKKKIQKKIEDINQQTQIYYEDFIKNPDHYEKYGQE